MLNLIRFEPGATVPLHSHPHEQLGIVLEGMQALVVEGVAHEFGPMRRTCCPAASSTRPTADRTARSSSMSSSRCARTTASAGAPRRRNRPCGVADDGEYASGTQASEKVCRDGSEGDRWPQTTATLAGRYTPAATPARASVTAAQVVTVETFWSA